VGHPVYIVLEYFKVVIWLKLMNNDRIFRSVIV